MFLGNELRDPPTQRSRISPMLLTDSDDDDTKSDFNLFFRPTQNSAKIPFI